MEQEKAAAEMQRKLQYGDAVRSRMLPTPGVNDDPTGYMNAYLQNSPFMTPEMINNYDEMTNAVYPQRTLTNTDLGDRNMQTVFDPRTGALNEAIQEYGVKPYEPNPVYQPGSWAADRPQGWTDADEAAYERAVGIGKEKKFMDEWRKKKGTNVPKRARERR
jgi:hypothetical protein